ncbi:MAG: copper chaperone PCu(A)C [Gammaproteobacteria bacterium]
MKTASVWLSLLLFCMLPANINAAGNTDVEGAWINEAPPTATVLAGYASLHNYSDQDIELIQVTSPAFNKVEIHQNVVKDDVASMVKQESLTISAASKVELSPGGLHLMLYQPESRLKAGDTVILEFFFSDGTGITTSAEVKRLQFDQHHHHNHNH